MNMTVEQMKQAACKAIDDNAQKILDLEYSIRTEPELGYKEFKTAAKIKAALDELGYSYTDGHAITGIITPVKGRDHKVNLAVMGELDAVLVKGHRLCDPVTGAAHCCGHSCQAASVIGVATALKAPGVMENLDGDITLMHVPSEEFVELEYRQSLKDEGKIKLFVDMMIMQHTSITENEGAEEWSKGNCGGAIGKGFVGKMIHYIGKESHAAMPSQGINALKAAQLGLTCIDANRETFRDEDGIRVHPIMTKGGDLVNVVPADVRLETYVRGSNTKAIFDASAKVDRALQAGAMAVGAQVEITQLPGYMCPTECDELKDVVYDNLKYVFGEDHCKRDGMGGSTDASDVAHIMPTCHMFIGGAAGTFHGESYCVPRPDIAVLDAAKAMVCTAIDLLANGAEKGLHIKENFKPLMTKEEYLEKWCGITE